MTHLRRAAQTPKSVGCNCLLGGASGSYKKECNQLRVPNALHFTPATKGSKGGHAESARYANDTACPATLDRMNAETPATGLVETQPARRPCRGHHFAAS